MSTSQLGWLALDWRYYQLLIFYGFSRENPIRLSATDANVPIIEATREAFMKMHDHLLTLRHSRERSLAITKLEESAMWAIKGIVFE